MLGTVKLDYDSNQYLLSENMQQFPLLAKILNGTLGYTNIGNYTRAKVFARQVSHLDLSSMNKILDLGCGNGENALMMSQALPLKKIYALDIDAAALQKVKSIKEKQVTRNFVVHHGKIDSLPESNFDLIYSVDVFEHMAANEMPFDECHAKLKKNGYLLVKIPNKRQHTVFNEKHFATHNQQMAQKHPGQVYFLYELEERFKKSGFRIVFAEQTDGRLARLAWEVAYFMKKGGALPQLLSLPICKLLVNLDLMINRNGTPEGNAITVIGQKN